MSHKENINIRAQRQTIYVDIWSDIVCPFCYIGKRNFEQALEQSGLKDSVKVIWHSFELAPGVRTDPGASIYEVLGKRKGWSLEQSKQIHSQMEQRAKLSGLDYDFDKTIPANSRNAHRLLHLAKQYGVQDDVKELLFKGYFTDGKNIDDAGFLTETGIAAGLNYEDIRIALESSDIDKKIEEDIENARKIGIQGVPFFVLNQKYAVSGAQPVDVFVQALEKVQKETDIKPLADADGAFCGTEGKC